MVDTLVAASQDLARPRAVLTRNPRTCTLERFTIVFQVRFCNDAATVPQRSFDDRSTIVKLIRNGNFLMTDTVQCVTDLHEMISLYAES